MSNFQDTSAKPVRDMSFRPGAHGFVFYEDGRYSDPAGSGRTWAFSTINEAAAWLAEQFPTTIFDDDGAKASAAPTEAASSPSESPAALSGLS